jgi:hypothetical protein
MREAVRRLTCSTVTAPPAADVRISSIERIMRVSVAAGNEASPQQAAGYQDEKLS